MTMVMRALLVLIWTSLIATTGFGQKVVNSKVLQEIKAKEEGLLLKEKELESANRILQDDYARLRASFVKAKLGKDRSLVADLERVLEIPIADANAAASAPRSNGKKVLRAFAKPLTKSLAKVEHELLVVFQTSLATAVSEAFETLNEEVSKNFETRELAEATIKTLLPDGKMFWKHWNETVATQVPSRAKFIAVNQAKVKLHEEIMVLKDPKMAFTLDAPEGMARIPGGSITLLSTYGFEAKKKKYKYNNFYIDLREVTHGEYWSKFWLNLKDKALKTAYMPRVENNRRQLIDVWVQELETGEYRPEEEIMNLPITGVDALACMAYAKSQNKRLPTSYEWVAAATATPGKTSEFPYGDKWRLGWANDIKHLKKGPLPVGSFKDSRSYYGLYDVVGNVSEWTTTLDRGKTVADPPKGDEILCIRGGSYKSSPTEASLKWRWTLPLKDTRLPEVGFRCAQDIPLR